MGFASLYPSHDRHHVGDILKVAKIPLTIMQIRSIYPLSPPTEGRFAIVTIRRAQDAMDAVGVR